jgi:hypothetical protein
MPVQVEPEMALVQIESEVVPVQVEPGVVPVWVEPGVVTVQAEPGVVSGPTDLGVIVLVDTSVPVLGWHEASGHHTEVFVGQDELGSVACQDDAVGGTEKINVPESGSGILFFMLQQLISVVGY